MKESSHFYSRDGQPKYEVLYADPSKGMRKSTLADAKKHGWLPSVTTITRVLAAPSLVEWLRREAATAVATTPRRPDEPLDDFVERCLAVDAESVADAAKELGSAIHAALELALGVGLSLDMGEYSKFTNPAIAAVHDLGRVVATEKILVGDEYAGKTDCIVENDEWLTVIDFKTTGSKVLPKKSYFENQMQLAAYAKALGNTGTKKIRTANIYISTKRPGEISVCVHDD